MSQTYFKNFNDITYQGVPAVDLTERIVVQQSQQYNPFIFYPLDISDGIRADMIAYSAWGDPYASWVLYLTNNIVDPYYDYYLNQEQFTNFITEKYGSITNAQQLVLYFQTDYANQPAIDISGYNALDADQKKYYEPNYKNSSFLQNYTVKQQSLTVTTNYIISLSISNTTGSFTNNEMLSISYVPGSNGTAQYMTGNSTAIIVQHSQGNAFPYPDNPNTNIIIANSSIIQGLQSGCQASITGYQILAVNIPLDEEIFWSPVFAYDYEVAKNAGNRIVNVMQPKYVPIFVNNTANLLSQVFE